MSNFQARSLNFVVCATLLAIFGACGGRALASENRELADKAIATAMKAAETFHNSYSYHGTYLWAYSADGKVRRGEGPASPNQGWNQPPGTPAIGAAFLRLVEITGDKRIFGYARETALAVARAQLLSGGWYYSTTVQTGADLEWCWRVVSEQQCDAIEGNKYKNTTVLDDNTTQANLAFLIWYDQIAPSPEQEVKDAITFGLSKLLRLQYKNGAFPILTREVEHYERVNPELFAHLPEGEWSRTWVKPEQPPYYITNDDAIRDTVRLLLAAEKRIGGKELLDSAVRAGEFLLHAQLPAPHRGWAQTYNSDMQPVWGRKFEPPSVASRETAGAVDALVRLYRRTGDERFIVAAKEAIAWLKSVRLDDGTWARFYELRTNRALYINNKLEPVYEPRDLMEGYTFKGDFSIPVLMKWVESVENKSVISTGQLWVSQIDDLPEEVLRKRVSDLVGDLAPDGRWSNKGWVSSDVFIDAVFAATRYAQIAK